MTNSLKKIDKQIPGLYSIFHITNILGKTTKFCQMMCQRKKREFKSECVNVFSFGMFEFLNTPLNKLFSVPQIVAIIVESD